MKPRALLKLAAMSAPLLVTFVNGPRLYANTEGTLMGGKLVFNDEFEGPKLDLTSWRVIRGGPTVGERAGYLTLRGGATEAERAEVQSIPYFQYGILRTAIESSDWKSYTLGEMTDSSFGFETWVPGFKSLCHYGVILIANGHLGLLQSQPNEEGRCPDNPLYQDYRQIPNWDAVRKGTGGRIYLTLTWSPTNVTLEVSNDDGQTGMASSDVAIPTVPLPIRLNADMNEAYHVDYVRVSQ